MLCETGAGRGIGEAPPTLTTDRENRAFQTGPRRDTPIRRYGIMKHS